MRLKLFVRIITKLMQVFVKRLYLNFPLLMRLHFVERLAEIINPLLLRGGVLPGGLGRRHGLGLNLERERLDQLHEGRVELVGDGEGDLAHGARYGGGVLGLTAGAAGFVRPRRRGASLQLPQ